MVEKKKMREREREREGGGVGKVVRNISENSSCVKGVRKNWRHVPIASCLAHVFGYTLPPVLVLRGHIYVYTLILDESTFFSELLNGGEERYIPGFLIGCCNYHNNILI